jgi:nicotinate-nucleotide adenylyltransferase
MRNTGVKNLKESTGDLLASLIQLCNESEWDINDLIDQNIGKINRREQQYLSLGRKKRVAILGGAFNMVTIGHIQTAQFVLDSAKFDMVFLMPCYSHMYNKQMESPEHRLNMCKLATNVDARIKVFDYEIKNELAGETFKLVKMLNNDSDYEQYEFAFIMGQDNANTFNKWVNYEHLEKMMKFVVIPRKGVERDLNIDWYLNKPHIFLNSEETNIMDVSSTLVRNLLKENKTEELQKYLNKDVINYILENKLYE